jgi:hypothetical protein
MKAAAQWSRAAGAQIAPSVRCEIERPGVIESAGVCETVRDHHAVPRRIVNGRVPVPPAGSNSILTELPPRVLRRIERPDIVEEAARLAAEYDYLLASRIEDQGVAKTGRRPQAGHLDFAPPPVRERIDPEIVPGRGVLPSKQINLPGRWVVSYGSVESRGWLRTCGRE